jgi:sugar/nucleoside kinase (ribokinase family)
MSKVASLGIHIVDVLGRPVSSVPPGQGLALLEQIRFTVAGTAAGASVDMAKLGLKVFTMGAIGNDEIGDFLVATMQKFGIDTSGLVRKQGVQTSCTMLPIRPNGERPALHVIGANGELSFEDINFETIASSEFLHLGGTPLLTKLDGEPASRVLRFAKEKNVTTTFDLLGLPRPDLQHLVTICLPYTDFFMPNYEEGTMISGLSERGEIMRFFLNAGAKQVVIREGGDGCTLGWLENEVLKQLSFGAFDVPVVDSTGCGDGFNAGFIKGLSLGWDWERSLRLGSACGALIVQGLGSDAGIESFEQVMEFADRTRLRS